MPNEFGGPTAKASFLTSLLGSTMGYFKDEHDKNQAEDLKRKQMDYQILMAALEQMKPNLTPSQAGEILTRATDIFKPKGHTGVKERITEMFGRHDPYQMQGGQILKDVGQMPRKQIDLAVDPSAAPSVFDTGYGKVTLPPPPEIPVYEPTYREQELQDKERLIEANTDRQLAVEERRALNRRIERTAQNKAIVERTKEVLGIKEDYAVMRKLRERAAIYNPSDPTDPEAMATAAASLQDELEQKKQLGQQKIEHSKRRLEQLDEGLKLARQRVDNAAKRLGATKATNWNNDPQVRGAWKKVDQYRNEAGRLRTEASIRYSEGDTEGGEILTGEAEKAEATMQDIVNGIEERIRIMSGGVTLPNPNIGGRNTGVTLEGAINAFRQKAQRDPTPQEIENIKRHYGLK